MTPAPRPLVVVVDGTSGTDGSGLVETLGQALEDAGIPTATLAADVGAAPGLRGSRPSPRDRALAVLLHGSEDGPGRPAVILVAEPSGRDRPPLDVEADLVLHLAASGTAVDLGGDATARSGADLVLDANLAPADLRGALLAAVTDRLPEHRRNAGPVPPPGASGRWHRRAARVLPQDPAGAVLLVLCTNPDETADPFWIAAGGGVEASETARQAVVRELWEETGRTVDPSAVAGPVHAETVVFRWGSAQVVQRQEYFTVRVPDRATTTAHLDGAEARSVLEHRWWPPEEVLTTPAAVLPGVRLAVAALLAR